VRKIIVYFLSICLLMGVIPLGKAVPYAEAAASETAYDGYLVCLDIKDEASWAENQDLLDSAEEIYAPVGLYQVDDLDLVEQMREREILVYAEPNYVVKLDSSTVDTTSYSSYLWHMNTIGARYAQDNAITGVTQDGERVRVGVIDSGLYPDHEGFQDMTVIEGTNYCVSKESANRHNTADTVKHGTFVTGVIAASLNSRGVVQGIAPDVEIVPLKCFDETTGSVALIIQALYDAVDTYQCDVLNMSFAVEGQLSELTSLTNAIDYASDNGIILVAAVGNLSSSTGNDPLQYPAGYDNVIGVGSVNSSKVVSSFSYENASVFVTAPGEYIYGANTKSTYSYAVGSGTSYAAPMVTAAAALALSVDPTLTPEEFQTLLADTSEDLGAAGYDYAYGYGMLRVDNLLQAMEDDWFVTGDAATGYTMSVRRQGLEPFETVQVAEVAYDETGRMISFSVLELVTVDKDGTLSIRNLSLPGVDGAAQVKLMLLGSNKWEPLGSCWSNQ
jgi:subtilisin family serine protease